MRPVTDRVLLTAVIVGTAAAFAFGLYGWLHGIVHGLAF